jgi:hypothetical protein
VIVVCAWCERFLGLREPSTQADVSHGMCGPCRERYAWKKQPVLVVNRDLAGLADTVREILRGQPPVRVIVDRRHGERRAGGPRASATPDARRGPERRGRACFELS